MKILIIDDDLSIQRAAALGLVKKGGHEVVSSLDGASGIARAESLMPEFDGLEICRRLKANPKTKPIPIIFLTADSEQPALSVLREQGALGRIDKPFNPLTLSERVEALLRPSAPSP